MTISIAPSEDDTVRRSTRVLAMVHELHKAGYQRLRICAGRSWDGAHWRCIIAPANNFFPAGWDIRSAENCALYSSDQGSAFFGWEDAREDTARQLAQKFVDRYTRITREAEGQDWEYSGWFTSIIGAAERGRLPVLFGGGNVDNKMADALPPALPLGIEPSASDTGFPIIPSEVLGAEDLPNPDTDYEDLVPFCLSFHPAAWCLRTGADLEIIVPEWERRNYRDCTLDELRGAAFYRQRCAKWASTQQEMLSYLPRIRAPIAAIWALLLAQLPEVPAHMRDWKPLEWVDPDVLYLGDEHVARTLVSEFSSAVTHHYSGFLGGTEAMAQPKIEKLALEYGDIFMGRNARYKIAPWQGEKMQGKLVATIPKMKWTDDPGVGLFRFAALLCVKACIGLTNGHDDEEVGRALKSSMGEIGDLILGKEI